jgi:hypothetical protein
MTGGEGVSGQWQLLSYDRQLKRHTANQRVRWTKRETSGRKGRHIDIGNYFKLIREAGTGVLFQGQYEIKSFFLLWNKQAYVY